MAKRENMGEMVCPECGRTGAVIRRQKNGMLYRWCEDGCHAQFFARTREQEEGMRKHLAPVTDTAQKAEPQAKPAAPVSVPVSVPELPKKKGTGNAFLDLMQGV